MKNHAVFESVFLDNYAVVEERQGNRSLYPHTEELPLISRAINLEFYGALPNRVASTDHRADGFRKYMLETAARHFCVTVNADRQDQLRLMPCYTPELVTKIGILQHIKATQPLGVHHSVRFFTGTDFMPDLHLSGKRFGFATHVIDRFTSRTPHHIADHVTELLETMLHYPAIVGHVGSSQALVYEYNGSIIALTYEDHGNEYFFTTCLTHNEINSLWFDSPPHTLHFHYGSAYTAPTTAARDISSFTTGFLECWQQRKPFNELHKLERRERRKAWRILASHINELSSNRSQDLEMRFFDDIYGPVVTYLNDEKGEPQTLHPD
jgi:hypothetical protein